MEKYTFGEVVDLMGLDEVAIFNKELASDLKYVDGYRAVSGFYFDTDNDNILTNFGGEYTMVARSLNTKPLKMYNIYKKADFGINI